MAVDLLKENKLWDCRECKREKLQKDRYCAELGQSNQFEAIEIDGRDYSYCPVSLIDQATVNDLAEAVQVKTLRTMPCAGGLNDQYHRDVEVISLVIAKLGE